MEPQTAILPLLFMWFSTTVESDPPTLSKKQSTPLGAAIFRLSAVPIY
jgi:hypothetical protein